MSKPRLWLRDHWIYIAIVFGFSARLLVAFRGENYDMESFKIVAEIVDRGGNVYSNTSRYNYGPVWFNLLYIIKQAASVFSSNRDMVFRFIIAGMLSFVDLGIFLVLRERFGRKKASLFLLNPISIIITGYHSQFENLVLLLGLLSVMIFEDSPSPDGPFGWRRIAGLVVLGLSIMTKHILFAFPFWLAVKQRNIKRKIAVFFIPILVFLMGFIPYWQAGQGGIIKNVFMYDSWNNEFFYKLFVPGFVTQFISAEMFWLFMLTIFAFVFRRKSSFESLLLYTLILVATSPAIANQYLSIVIPAISVSANLFFGLYTTIGTWHLLVDSNGLHFPELQNLINISMNMYYAILISLLCLGIVWLIWQKRIIGLAKTAIAEVRFQFGHE